MLAFSGRGESNLEKGQYAEAIANYSKVIKTDPNHGASYNHEIAKIRLEDYEGTITYFGNAIGMNPRFHDAYYLNF